MTLRYHIANTLYRLFPSRFCWAALSCWQMGGGDGREPEPVTAECGIFCEVDFADLESTNLQAVLNGNLTIYQAAYK